jgi:hypothetical protein
MTSLPSPSTAAYLVQSAAASVAVTSQAKWDKAMSAQIKTAKSIHLVL